MSNDNKTLHTGSCLCGAVKYEVRGPLREGTACHCDQCRRSTGSLWHATAAWRDTVEIIDPDERLTWFLSSDQAQRGFCNNCGSTLFFDPIGADRLAIALGTLDKPTGLRMARHIFIEEKGDYYEISDDVPKGEAEAIELPMPERD